MFKENRMGIAIGAGAGIIVGELLFNNIGVGISIGTCMGIIWGRDTSKNHPSSTDCDD